MLYLQRKVEDKYTKDKKYHRGHCHYKGGYRGSYRGSAHRICHLKYSIPKIITIFFHNGSNYHYYFIIKEVAEEYEG